MRMSSPKGTRKSPAVLGSRLLPLVFFHEVLVSVLGNLELLRGLCDTLPVVGTIGVPPHGHLTISLLQLLFCRLGCWTETKQLQVGSTAKPSAASRRCGLLPA